MEHRPALFMVDGDKHELVRYCTRCTGRKPVTTFDGAVRECNKCRQSQKESMERTAAASSSPSTSAGTGGPSTSAGAGGPSDPAGGTDADQPWKCALEQLQDALCVDPGSLVHAQLQDELKCILPRAWQAGGVNPAGGSNADAPVVHDDGADDSPDTHLSASEIVTCISCNQKTRVLGLTGCMRCMLCTSKGGFGLTARDMVALLHHEGALEDVAGFAVTRRPYTHPEHHKSPGLLLAHPRAVAEGQRLHRARAHRTSIVAGADASGEAPAKVSSAQSSRACKRGQWARSGASRAPGVLRRQKQPSPEREMLMDSRHTVRMALEVLRTLPLEMAEFSLFLTKKMLHLKDPSANMGRNSFCSHEMNTLLHEGGMPQCSQWEGILGLGPVLVSGNRRQVQVANSSIGEARDEWVSYHLHPKEGLLEARAMMPMLKPVPAGKKPQYAVAATGNEKEDVTPLLQVARDVLQLLVNAHTPSGYQPPRVVHVMTVCVLEDMVRRCKKNLWAMGFSATRVLVDMFFSVSMLIAKEVDNKKECNAIKLHSRLALAASRLLRPLHRVQDTAFWNAYQEAIIAIILRLQSEDEFKLDRGRRDNVKLQFDPCLFDSKLDNASNVGNKGPKVVLPDRAHMFTQGGCRGLAAVCDAAVAAGADGQTDFTRMVREVLQGCGPGVDIQGSGKKRAMPSQHTPCKRMRGGAAEDSAADDSSCVSNQVIVVSDSDSENGDDPVLVPAPPVMQHEQLAVAADVAPAEDAAPDAAAAAPDAAAAAPDAAVQRAAVLAGIHPLALTTQGTTCETSAPVERQCNDLTDATPELLAVLVSVTAQVCSPVVHSCVRARMKIRHFVVLFVTCKAVEKCHDTLGDNPIPMYPS